MNNGRTRATPGDGSGIENVSLKAALEERYLAYALSTIMHRALPDARDGLKPVQRRILHAMRLLRLDPANAYKKCASVVGEVIGKFHPHGDQAIYDAMVRLAQDFAQRYMLVDGQGNFGSIDGDNAAAYRYTEAKLTEVAPSCCRASTRTRSISAPPITNENEEPVVLPGAFPNLLANGTTGIAVGMATAIPPHNAAELCDAALYLIEHPKATPEQLVTFVPGPDFPTGGIVVEPASSIVETYRTGRGGFRVRARWHKEDTGRGTYVIVVTEIPYLVQKGRLIEALADLINERKVPILADVRDESAEDIRIVLEPKSRSVDENMLMESLFKLTELETRISMNMNVLVDGLVPRVIGLGEALRIWLDHRRVVLQRRSRHRLAEIERRLERLGGLLIAFLNLDEVIRIIREEDEPKPALIKRFDLTDLQAETILDTRLRQLRKLEEMELRKEFDELTIEKGQIEELLGSDKQQWKTIAWEIREVKEEVRPRHEARQAAFDLRRQARGLCRHRPQRGAGGARADHRRPLGQGLDPCAEGSCRRPDLAAVQGRRQDAALVPCGDHGQAPDAVDQWQGLHARRLEAAGRARLRRSREAPRRHRRGRGDRGALAAPAGREAADGRDRRQRRARLRRGLGRAHRHDQEGQERAFRGRRMEGCAGCSALGDHVAIVGENRKLLVFPLSEVPEMTRGKGVRLQRYKDGGVADVKVFDAEGGLTWTSADGRTYTVARPELYDWLGHRAEAGKLPPKGFPKNGKFVG